MIGKIFRRIAPIIARNTSDGLMGRLEPKAFWRRDLNADDMEFFIVISKIEDMYDNKIQLDIDLDERGDVSVEEICLAVADALAQKGLPVE